MSERYRNMQENFGKSDVVNIPIMESPIVMQQASRVARLAVQKTSLEEFSHTLGCGCHECQRQTTKTGEWVKDLLSTNTPVETIVTDARYGLLAISLLGGREVL